jgi:cytoskeletal protein CcmA (bactofilin family)
MMISVPIPPPKQKNRRVVASYSNNNTPDNGTRPTSYRLDSNDNSYNNNFKNQDHFDLIDNNKKNDDKKVHGKSRIKATNHDDDDDDDDDDDSSSSNIKINHMRINHDENNNNLYNINDNGNSSNSNIVGAGYNVPKHMKLKKDDDNNRKHKIKNDDRNNIIQDGSYSNYVDDGRSKSVISFDHLIPDTLIGEGVEVYGEYYYDNYIRIDGTFEGLLHSSSGSSFTSSTPATTTASSSSSLSSSSSSLSSSKGNIFIGKSGRITCDIIIAKIMIISGGQVYGKIVVDELLIENEGSQIHGDITCKYLEIYDKKCKIFGRLNIHLLAPNIIDNNNNIVMEIPKKIKKKIEKVSVGVYYYYYYHYYYYYSSYNYYYSSYNYYCSLLYSFNADLHTCKTIMLILIMILLMINAG